MFGPKKVLSKNIFWSKKLLVQNQYLAPKKMLLQEKICYKKICSKNIFWPKNFLSEINFGPKKIFGLKFFCI